MIEAAVVLPMVILSVVALIYILSFLYNETVMGAKVHVASNAVMGRETGVSVTHRHIPTGVDTFKSTAGSEAAFFGRGGIKFKRRGLFKSNIAKKVESGTYEVDEKKFIRYTDVFK